MADESKPTEETTEGSIDYSGKQAEIDKAKQKARDDDAKRLAEEHE
jgi:hypothetical protein